jgi:hypothetical protein
LVHWNQKINLTAITDPLEVNEKHLVDSLTLLPLLGNARRLKPCGKTSCLAQDVTIGVGSPKEMQERRIRIVPGGALQHGGQADCVKLGAARSGVIIGGRADIHVSNSDASTRLAQANPALDALILRWFRVNRSDAATRTAPEQ